MLVLRRKKNTVVVSDSGMRLEIVQVSQQKVFLSIRWPSGKMGLWLGLMEEVTIDQHITVKIIGLEPGAVKLGIEAPATVRIMREELLSMPEQSLEGTIWAGK